MSRSTTRDESLPTLTPRQKGNVTPFPLPAVEEYQEEEHWREQYSTSEYDSERQDLPMTTRDDEDYVNNSTFRLQPGNGDCGLTPLVG